MPRVILVVVILPLVSGLMLGARAAECPDGCACYNGFVTVKCTDSPLRDLPRFDKQSMAKVAVLDMTRCQLEELRVSSLSRYPKLKRLILKDNGIKKIERNALEKVPTLTELDLRGNDLKSLPRGIFSKSNLKVLFLEHNPFSCDSSTIHVLHTEIMELMSEDTDLEMFDGGKLKCADPSNLQGEKVIYLPDKVLQASFLKSGKLMMGYSTTTLVLVVMVTFLVTASVPAGFLLYKRFQKPLRKDSVSSMEEGESLIDLETAENAPSETPKPDDDGDLLAKSLQTLRRKSQGYPSGDIVDSADEDTVEPEEYIKEKMEQQRRHSLGYPRDEHSSNESMEEINLDQ